MEASLLTVCYLIGSVTFIIGLKMLSDPAHARKGNLIAAGGMTLAIIATIFLYTSDGEKLHNYGWIFGGLAIGGIIGTLAAKKVKMTSMPEMVSIFNGMGGACAALISIVEFDHLLSVIEPVHAEHVLIILLGCVIGTVSFAGSIIAWGKLNGSIKDYSFKGQHIINLFVLGLIVIGSAYMVATGEDELNPLLFYAIIGMSIVYGVQFVLPIGGADMPVVISLLNSFTGVAAACGGFLYNNKVMLTGGILVGAAGTLLTILMCKAMNRSLKNVLIGSFGASHEKTNGPKKDQGTFKEISINDAAVVMSYASKVIIVPGYGLAVAQAQHVCHELEKILTEKGVDLRYAIHPVAGRMPGHMNVLLAEADVSYDKLMEMEQANEEFPTTDVVLVLGANDVVNPAAKTDPNSPIYGMPILDVELAKMVIVNKRSMKPGYAGIENDLFFQPRTSMLFGDAKTVLQQLVAEIKTL
jgi:NAD(P) transhydrogenase subunit beta